MLRKLHLLEEQRLERAKKRAGSKAPPIMPNKIRAVVDGDVSYGRDRQQDGSHL